MDIYEVHPRADGYVVSGGQLTEPLLYHEPNETPIVHLVGFPPNAMGQPAGVITRLS